MQVIRTEIPEVLVVEPKVMGDERGFFMETFSAREWEEAVGGKWSFVQDNHSRSGRGVLRGLHYQIKQAQGKLVRVVAGEVFDVAVDLRRSSGTFGKWVGVRLSGENKRMMWVPPGFGHGFLVLRGPADFLYKTTDYYAPEWERTLLWNDGEVGVKWPVEEVGGVGGLVVSKKDVGGRRLGEAEVFE